MTTSEKSAEVAEGAVSDAESPTVAVYDRRSGPGHDKPPKLICPTPLRDCTSTAKILP